jgi:hypothetical protein
VVTVSLIVYYDMDPRLHAVPEEDPLPFPPCDPLPDLDGSLTSSTAHVKAVECTPECVAMLQRHSKGLCRECFSDIPKAYAENASATFQRLMQRMLQRHSKGLCRECFSDIPKAYAENASATFQRLMQRMLQRHSKGLCRESC